MVIIIVKASVKKENVSLFEERLELVANVAKKLDGCNTYEWYEHPKEANSYTVYGEFSSIDTFKKYKKSSVVEMIVDLLIPLMTTKPSFKHFHAEIFEQG